MFLYFFFAGRAVVLSGCLVVATLYIIVACTSSACSDAGDASDRERW